MVTRDLSSVGGSGYILCGAAYAGADIMGVSPLQVRPISVLDVGIDQGSFPARTALNMDGLSSKFGVGPINAGIP